jgi:hypothetical protein
LAANVGVTLSLIAQPEDATDLSLSDHVREAALAGVFAASQVASGSAPDEVRASAALALTATLNDGDLLTAGERALLGELLHRLSGRALVSTPSG